MAIVYKTQVLGFNNQFFFMHPYYKCKFTYEGYTFKSAESAFRAMSVDNKMMREMISYMDPYEIRDKLKDLEVRSDWDDVKLDIMQEINKAKFEQNENLKIRLVETGDKKLMNINMRSETFWGIDGKTKSGENHLGKILEELREEFAKDLKKEVVRTSYFAKAKGKYKNVVSIASSLPEGLKLTEYPALAPTKEISQNYRQNHDKEEYTRKYQEDVLSKLDPVEVWKELGSDPVLVCWEGSDKFCHRHIAAKWLAEANGIEYKEV